MRTKRALLRPKQRAIVSLKVFTSVLFSTAHQDDVPEIDLSDCSPGEVSCTESQRQEEVAANDQKHEKKEKIDGERTFLCFDTSEHS